MKKKPESTLSDEPLNNQSQHDTANTVLFKTYRLKFLHNTDCALIDKCDAHNTFTPHRGWMTHILWDLYRATENVKFIEANSN